MTARVNRKAELPLTAVTGEHFAKAVPGDQCHCTLGEATRDVLGSVVRLLGLASADPTTIRVFPAEADDEPCVGVAFQGTTIDGEQVRVGYLLQDATAFKIANVTDNRAASSMRRRAAVQPYELAASGLTVRSVQGAGRASYHDTARPEVNVKTRAGNAVQDSGTVEGALAVFNRRLDTAAAQGKLPFELTPQLRELGEDRVRSSFAAKGTRPGRRAPVRLYRNKRFYS
jgi:hypothetical protein